MTTPVNHFIIVWNRDGLESLHDVEKINVEYSFWERAKIWDILKEQSSSVHPPRIPIQQLILRAARSSNLMYEIYEFETVLSSSKVKEHFTKYPEKITEQIRNVGYKIYSNT